MPEVIVWQCYVNFGYITKKKPSVVLVYKSVSVRILHQSSQRGIIVAESYLSDKEHYPWHGQHKPAQLPRSASQLRLNPSWCTSTSSQPANAVTRSSPRAGPSSAVSMSSCARPLLAACAAARSSHNA